jgi:hypothetical protein
MGDYQLLGHLWPEATICYLIALRAKIDSLRCLHKDRLLSNPLRFPVCTGPVWIFQTRDHDTFAGGNMEEITLVYIHANMSTKYPCFEEHHITRS